MSNKIASFVVTLLAIPFLFVGTCVPVGLIAIGTSTSHELTAWHAPEIIFTIYAVVLIAVLVGWAIRTSNAGVRWGIVTTLVVAAIYAADRFIVNV